MSDRLHVNLTAASLLADEVRGAGIQLARGADEVAAACGAAGLEPGAARSVAAAAEALLDVESQVRRFLEQVRSLDQPHGYVVWRGAEHPAFADPAPSLAAARRVVHALGGAFSFGLGGEEVDRLVDLLAQHEGDPVFSLEVVRTSLASSDGFGQALWALSAAPLGRRQQVHEVARRLGAVLAVAERAARHLVTYDTVMADLGRATGGDPAQLAMVPVLLAATARPFTRGFLRPLVAEQVLAPNRRRLELGRALPATWVHDGSRQRDVRSLVLDAVAHNPRAAAELLSGRTGDGTPNLHLLLGDELLDPTGPGVLDGDGGRALARVIDAGTRARPGAWWPPARVTHEEAAAAAGAVVEGFGARAPALGWELPTPLHDVLGQLTVRTLPSFQLVPPSFTGSAAPPVVPPGAAEVPPRETGLRFLSLLFSRRATEDLVVGAAQEHLERRSAELGADVEGHLGLGLLWGALADASLGGRLVHAVRQDHARDEERATWELAQLVVEEVIARKVGGGSASTGGSMPGALEGLARDHADDGVAQVGSQLEDLLLADEQRTEAVLAGELALLDGRRQELARLLAPAPGSPGWSAALGGFEGGIGPTVAPPGYVEPDPAVLVRLDDALDGPTAGAGS